MRTFIENYLHFMKNCIRPPYKKLKTLKSGFIENSNFENNRDPWCMGKWCLSQTPLFSKHHFFWPNTSSLVVNDKLPTVKSQISAEGCFHYDVNR